MLERIRAFILPTSYLELPLPSDLINIQSVRFDRQWDVEWRDEAEFNAYVGQNGTTSDRPEVYSIHPYLKKIRFYPIPSSATPQYNSTLFSAISSTSAIQCALVSGTTFPSFGRILIGPSGSGADDFNASVETGTIEQIQYFSKLTVDVLDLMRRGDGETTALTHLSGAYVRYAPLEIRYSYMPPAMVVSSVDCRLPKEYEEAIIAYATSTCFRAKDKYATAGQNMKIYTDLLDEAMKKVAERQRDRLPRIKDEPFYHGE